MDKIWFEHYPEGVPLEIDPSTYSTLVDYAEKTCEKYKHNKAFTNYGTSLTFHDLNQKSLAFAGFLQHECKMEPQDRLAIMLPNTLQYPVVLLGALRAGLIVVNLNPLLRPRQLLQMLDDSGAKCVIVLENFAFNLEQVLESSTVEYVVVSQLGDMFSPLKRVITHWVGKYIKKVIPNWYIPGYYPLQQALNLQYQHHFNAVDIQPEDTAFLQYTGGETGWPKGVMLTHRNLVANTLQAQSWIIELLNAPLKGCVVTVLPFYHMITMMVSCLVYFGYGVENVLITNPRDINSIIDVLNKHPFAVITGVNTLFNALLKHRSFSKLDFSHLRFSLAVGMSAQPEVVNQWHKVTGNRLLSAYGLTEASPGVSCQPRTLNEYQDNVGQPLPSTEIKVCDEAGHSVSLGEVGELYVRGPQVMKGYWQQPEVTALVLDKDGWLKTGDLVTVDNKGFIRIKGRIKHHIVVSGFNVSPTDVEEVILEMPEVKEVAVIGVPKASGDEMVKAVIVKEDPNLTMQVVLDYCKDHLTGYKVPRIIEFRDQLPMLKNGKVNKPKLREDS